MGVWALPLRPFLKKTGMAPALVLGFLSGCGFLDGHSSPARPHGPGFYCEGRAMTVGPARPARAPPAPQRPYASSLTADGHLQELSEPCLVVLRGSSPRPQRSRELRLQD